MEDYSVNWTQKISEDIKKKYIKSDRCLMCKLQEERIPPSCLLDCNFSIQYTEEDKIGPVVVTKVNQDSFSIDMPRSILSFNYYFIIPYIFRCTPKNGFIMHYKDGDPFNDNPTNLILLDGLIKSVQLSTHYRMLKLDNKVRRILLKYNSLMGQKEKNKLYNYLFEIEKLKMESIKFDHDSRVSTILPKGEIE